MSGTHCVKSWATTQAFISLSSGESEYYGVVKATSILMGMKSMLSDMGVQVEIECFTDATAAQGIASRRGLSSRTRHVQVHFLWVQEHVISGRVQLSKVYGNDNPADLLTKYFTRDKIAQYMKLCNLRYLEGRAECAPALGTVFR